MEEFLPNMASSWVVGVGVTVSVSPYNIIPIIIINWSFWFIV